MIDKRFYGKAGGEYDLFKLACPHYEELHKTLGETLREAFESSDKESIIVLEIGCGTGFTTEIILKSDPRIKVIAVDNEEVMINQAKRLLSDYSSEGRVTFVHEDCLGYLKSLQENSVDAFVSGFTLHNFDQDFRSELIIELFRVLRNGGLFINADKYAQESKKEHQKELDWQLKQFNDKFSEINRADLKEEWTKHYLEDNDNSTIMNESEAIKKMQMAGFVDVRKIYRKHMEAIMVASIPKA